MSCKSPLKVALLADTHGILDDRIAEVISGSDWVVHAGDIGGATVLHRLAQLGNNVVAVRGNNDVSCKWPIQNHDTLNALANEQSIELPGGAIVVVHGHRLMPAHKRHQKLRQRYPDARAVVYGHSHRLAEDYSTYPWVFNPGAAGKARTYGGPSCLLLHIKGEKWLVEQHRFTVTENR